MAGSESSDRAEYSEENIRVLRDVEHIRRHPGMFIGNPSASGLSHILFEFVTNSLAEVIAGHGRSVRVVLHVDGSASVADDGRTLPADTIERAFTVLETGYWGTCPYLTGRDYGHSVIGNALSEWLEVAVRNAGRRCEHGFERAVTTSVSQTGGSPDDCGLTITFRPDPEIFGGATFDREAIRHRLQQLAYLHSGVRITLTDEASGTRDEYEFTDGIASYVRWLNAERGPLHADVIIIRGEEQGVRYEIGLQWSENENEMCLSFANHYGTRQGGTHDDGVRAGAAAVIREFVREFQSEAGELLGEDIRTGLTAVVSVWLAEPTFYGPTRMQLSNPEAEAIVRTVVQRGVREYFEANREAAQRVVDCVILARDLRVAARAARKQLRQSKRGE